MIAIINYGTGNLQSIANMLGKLGHNSIITNKYEDIQSADKLILPGVGAFDTGMSRLEEFGLIQILNKEVLDKKKPVLGICLGMQLMAKGSEEGRLPGLGWIDAEFKRFNTVLPIPNIGWNTVKILNESRLTKGLTNDSRFYYVHSYHAVCHTSEIALMSSVYDYEYISAYESGNIVGVQFHPEKSHLFGMTLLKNFIENY
jgi:glutamine amidotransferase